MQIHFIRNAALIIEVGAERILVDPMLGPKRSLPPYAFLRHKPRLNPTVPLPQNIDVALGSVTAGLITHCRFGHFDHLDKSGSRHLAKLGIPVFCNHLDENYLQKRNIQTMPLKPNQKYPFCDGFIIPIETTHGYGVIGYLMGPGLGYLLEFPGEPSIYISGDTVLTPIVKKVLTDQKPDIATLASGAASLDIGKPILMPLSEQVEFIRRAPGIVIATHMEALNHCPVTRDQFRDAVTQEDLIHKVRVPMDGEVLLL